MRAIYRCSIAACAVGLALAGGGCSKKPTEGGVRLEQVSDAFNAAGLKTDNFQPTDPSRFNATKCLAGRVDNIDTVVCEYGSPDALALGKKAGEQWVGERHHRAPSSVTVVPSSPSPIAPTPIRTARPSTKSRKRSRRPAE